MGGIVSDIIGGAKKAAGAVAGEFEHIRPVPDPPQFDWSFVEQGLAQDEIKRLKEAKADEEAARTLKQGQLEGQGYENELHSSQSEEAKIKLGFLQQYKSALDDLSKVDWTKPEAKDQAERLREVLNRANEGFTGRAPNTHLTYPTGRMAEAAALGGVNPSKPVQDYDDQDTAAMAEGFRLLEQKERSSSSTSTDMYGNKSTSSHSESVHLGGKPVPAPPGASSHTARSGGSVPAPPKINSGPSSEQGEEEYKMLMNGAKITPKATEVANRFAVRHGLPSPLTVTPADRKSVAGLDNLEATFPDLERYSFVLNSTASRLRLQEIINAATKTGGGGALASMEGFIGAGVNAALVNSLTAPEKKFLLAYNQGREAVQTLRQFSGVSRSTRDLYNAMAGLLPNPIQTNSQEMARDQLKRLKDQIATIKRTLGGAGAPVPEAPTAEDDIPGFIPK